MLTAVDRRIGVPLYMQIRNQVRDLILSGDLPAGARLPAERELAASLGVNRTTVSSAYHELFADGLVGGRPGRGTVVQPRPSLGVSRREDILPEPLPWNEYFVALHEQARDPLIRQLVALCAQKDVISLAGGLPAPDLYPLDHFAAAIDHVLGRDGRVLLQHSPTEGHSGLREVLVTLMGERGVVASSENILVLSGSQQGLDLIARALIEPGDYVVVEAPSYLGALSAFRAAGARLLAVPMDEQGMRTDVLEGLLPRYWPRLIYTLPTFQNPSGRVMSLERRQALLSLAQQYQTAILEDDPYGELYFAEPPPPPVKSLDRQGHVIYLSTFSKLLFPGIRVGWIAAARPVVDRLASIKQFADLHTNTLAQWALTEFIRQGWLSEHVLTLRREYPIRREAMLNALRELTPRGLRWNEPLGGFYLWCHLEEGLRSRDLLELAAKHRVAFVIGEAFHADGGGQSAFRLNYTYQTTAGIREGMRRLAEALTAMMKRKQERQGPERESPRPIV